MPTALFGITIVFLSCRLESCFRWGGRFVFDANVILTLVICKKFVGLKSIKSAKNILINKWNNALILFSLKILQRAFVCSWNGMRICVYFSALFKADLNCVHDWSKMCVVLEHMLVFVCLRVELKPLTQPPWTDSQASMSHSYWVTDIHKVGSPWLDISAISAIALNAVH